MSCFYYYYLFLIFLVSIQDIREHQQQLIYCNLITTNPRRFAYDYQEQVLKLMMMMRTFPRLNKKFSKKMNESGLKANILNDFCLCMLEQYWQGTEIV